jgi:hypothetical protein
MEMRSTKKGAVSKLLYGDESLPAEPAPSFAPPAAPRSQPPAVTLRARIFAAPLAILAMRKPIRPPSTPRHRPPRIEGQKASQATSATIFFYFGPSFFAGVLYIVLYIVPAVVACHSCCLSCHSCFYQLLTESCQLSIQINECSFCLEIYVYFRFGSVCHSFVLENINPSCMMRTLTV